MAGVKRKQLAESSKNVGNTKTKKLKQVNFVARVLKPSKTQVVAAPDELHESDTTEDEFDGFSAKDDETEEQIDNSSFPSDVEMENWSPQIKKVKANGQGAANDESSSRESHAKQRALAKERKAAKPNADSIARSKKIWERLRRKSHVPPEERKELVEELFGIITGRVKEFVFKHDSVRVVQCALKYANMDQRKMITDELKGEFKSLTESKYAKFLVAKLIVEGDDEIKNLIISEFRGHVRRLINHPEASWILDDTYRSVANTKQKAALLSEWYGPEFAIFSKSPGASNSSSTADLTQLLSISPEKRKPIMEHLHHLINQLIQKKLTGFTMLHDAMLQYFTATKPGSTEAIEFIDLLKGEAAETENPDLLKNLAFTRSGSLLASLLLAYSTAKDRRQVLKAYRDNFELMAYDLNAHRVLLAAYDTVDDTVLLAKAIFPELLGGSKPAHDVAKRKLAELAAHPTARLTVTHILNPDSRRLLPAETASLIDSVRAIRDTTSKKDPETRRRELVRALSVPILRAIADAAPALTRSSFGCGFVAEALLSCAAEVGEGPSAADADALRDAVEAVADLAAGDPDAEPDTEDRAQGGADAPPSAEGEEVARPHISRDPFACRMLKTLALGGRFDPVAKKVAVARTGAPLGFADALWRRISPHIGAWAAGGGAFVVVGMLESEGFRGKEKALGELKAVRGRLVEVAGEEGSEEGGKVELKKAGKKRMNKGGEKVGERREGNAGTRLILKKL